jgi:hypothetical protein
MPNYSPPVDPTWLEARGYTRHGTLSNGLVTYLKVVGTAELLAVQCESRSNVTSREEGFLGWVN